MCCALRVLYLVLRTTSVVSRGVDLRPGSLLNASPLRHTSSPLSLSPSSPPCQPSTPCYQYCGFHSTNRLRRPIPCGTCTALFALDMVALACVPFASSPLSPFLSAPRRSYPVYSFPP